MEDTEKKEFLLNLRSDIIEVCMRCYGITDNGTGKDITEHVTTVFCREKKCSLDLLLELKYS